MRCLLVLAVLFGSVATADAGPLRRLFQRRHHGSVMSSAQQYPQPVQYQPQAQQPTGQPDNFSVAYQMPQAEQQFGGVQPGFALQQSGVAQGGATDELTSVVNRYRQQAGLRPLVTDASIVNYAQQWSQTMARTGMKHSNGWIRFGGLEVVAAGQTSAEQVTADWMRSPGHRRALMDPNVTRFGGARVANAWTGVTGR